MSEEMTMEIYHPLFKGPILLDIADYYLFRAFDWAPDTRGYVRTISKGRIYLHRLIMCNSTEETVDHIKGNKLDNRRSQLRNCSHSLNGMNRFVQWIGKSSKYKGVCLVKGKNKWESKIKLKGKKIHLGFFENEEDAAKAYDKKAFELYGEFAYLNFPQELKIKKIEEDK